MVRGAAFGMLAPEPMTEVLQVGRLQVRRGVVDDQQPARAFAAHAAHHLPAFGRIFQRVAQQVGHDPLDDAQIALYPGRRWQLGVDRDRARQRQLVQGRDQPSDQVGQVQRIGCHRVLSGFEPGQQQQRIDAALHARAGLDGRAQAAPGLGRIGIGQRGFGAGADFGQRGAQLMGHVPGKAAFARDRRIQALQAGVEGLGEGFELARKVVADGLHGRFGVQRRDPGAGPVQQGDHMPDHQQAQADGQHQGQHDPAQQGEMNAPLGPVPVLALGGHHQHAWGGIGRARRQARGQRPAGMAIGQHQVEIARRAAAFGAHRQRAAGAVG